VTARVLAQATLAGQLTAVSMVALAGLTRRGFTACNLLAVMSPREVITRAENLEILQDLVLAFELSCSPNARELKAGGRRLLPALL
jgi:cobaltochelatase CobS